MADIELFHDESEDSQQDDDDAGLGIDDTDDYGESFNPDEGLTPIQKLEKYMASENFYNRQMVARSLLEVMRMVADTDEDANTVLISMMKLSDDPECGVRTELMEQIPHIAMYCAENKEYFEDPIGTYILPIIVKYLLDSNNQVRKTSQAAMLVLLEQDLITKVDVEEHICPVIMEMSSPESEDDFRTEAVALMSKMAPLVGKDITERLFLPRFAEMCTDALFHVRKVCAANFGDMCAVVGQANTEETLLKKFYYLCEDGVWGVRKACAECFMQVSCTASQEIRRTQLAQLFISLICDQSRWVRMAAFQALGGFISTFADPNITGLFFNEEGVLMVGTPDGTKSVLDEKTIEKEIVGEPENEEGQCSSDDHTMQTNTSSEVEDMEIDVDDMQAPHAKSDNLSESSTQQEAPCENRRPDVPTCDTGVDEKSKVCEKKRASQEPGQQKPPNDDSNPSYNEFHYWRPPLPDIDIDVELGEPKPGATENESKSTTDVPKVVSPSPVDNNKKEEQEPTSKDQESPKDDTPAKQEPSEEQEGTKSDDNGPSPSDPVVDVSNVTLHLQDTHIGKVEPSSDDKTQSTTQENDTNDSENEVKLHTANVVTVTETPAEEEVANFGSMHVVGQQVDQHTMAIVDGVVQGTQDARLLRDLSNSSSYSPPEGQEAHIDDSLFEQDVIPQALLEHYLSMTDPSRAQTVDSEIALHCAYSLPAVAYTLGKRYWPCLKELYETLASDMQWKVRRTLAFSIHELAVIVGAEITCRDLVPVFNGFLKDLDEVRVGVLRHLADFLKLLTTEIRADYLSIIGEFLKTDNNRNWRFREELAKQLVMLLELYSPQEISQHLAPIALELAEDKVSQVRHEAFKVLSMMLKQMSDHPDQQIQMAFVNDLLERFAQSEKATQRQQFAHVCHYILVNDACPSVERFARDLLPSLLALGADSVPNVRITLAKVLAQHILSSDYFTSPNNPHHEDLLNTVQQLKADPDRDVRYYVAMQSITSELPDSIPV